MWMGMGGEQASIIQIFAVLSSHVDVHNVNYFHHNRTCMRIGALFPFPLLPVKCLLTTEFLECLFALFLGGFARIYTASLAYTTAHTLTTPLHPTAI